MGAGSHKSRGFTLVELMVVIAIIAVLAAIIIPVYARSRESARQTTCKGNLHAIAIALRNYLLDNGDYPLPYNPFTGEGGVTQLFLEGYLGSATVLRCPDDNTKVAEYNTAHNNLAGWTNWDEELFNERYSSYNEYFGGTDKAYALYNYTGYSGYPGETIDPDFPTGCGASRVDLVAIATANTLDLLDRDECNEAVIIWLDDNNIYEDIAHPNYDAADGIVFDRDPYEDEADTIPDLYARPLWDAANGTYSAYSPGLINSNAPDYTIITHCPWHRVWFGRGPQEKDLVVRLSGDTDDILVQNYDWVVQRVESLSE